MRAVGIRAFGGAAAVESLEVTAREPGQGEARINVGFAGVNMIDVAMRNGAFAQSVTNKTDLPLVLGLEGAGEVEKVGAGVTNVKAGDRVAWCLAGGAYAQQAIVPAWRLVRVPDGVPLDVAAALQLQGSTAHYLTTNAFPVQRGDVCVVHAAASGTGQLLTQMCKLKGAGVIATVGTKDKAAIAKARGADHVVGYRDEDFQKRVLELTGGAGAHVVYDSIGKDTLARSIRSVRRRGLCVSYGTASGAPLAVAPAELGEASSIFFTRPHLADYMQTADEIGGRVNDLFALHKGGQLAVTIDRVFPLAEAAKAHELMEGRNTRGKLLLKVG